MSNQCIIYNFLQQFKELDYWNITEYGNCYAGATLRVAIPTVWFHLMFTLCIASDVRTQK